MLEIGMLARSKAGHDKGEVFVVVELSGEYVFLADGKHRLLSRPKKKKRKHVQPIYVRHEIGGADDAALRKILKEYRAGRTLDVESGRD